jgi:hypothetical protein
MKAIRKLQDLAIHMDLEPAEETKLGSFAHLAPCGLAVEEKPRRKQKKNEDLGVFHAAMPGGKTIPLLKTLLTSLFAPVEITGAQPFHPMRWPRRSWI